MVGLGYCRWSLLLDAVAILALSYGVLGELDDWALVNK